MDTGESCYERVTMQGEQKYLEAGDVDQAVIANATFEISKLGNSPSLCGRGNICQYYPIKVH
jgi:hypothetical protein